MNPVVGWALVGAAFVVGWIAWGWRGLVLVVTVVVFWLLLQFSRSLRVLRDAGGQPVGHVDSAVMLHSRLRRGMTLMQVVTMTRSLGRKLGDAPERWGWSDAGGAQVSIELHRGKVQAWTLQRPAAGDPPAATDRPAGDAAAPG